VSLAVKDRLQDTVLDADLQRIVQALAGRSRYRYVQPLVQREGAGWKIVSPNCSRQIDPEGGLIDIAWLCPSGGRWQVHARRHQPAQWERVAQGLSLDEALAQVCLDPVGRFWP